jgi:hypothetical protein
VAFPPATRGAQRELLVTAEWMNGASGNEIEVIDGVADRECLELFSPGLTSLKSVGLPKVDGDG